MRKLALISFMLSLLLAACNLNTSMEGVTPTIPTAVSVLVTPTFPQTVPAGSTPVPFSTATTASGSTTSGTSGTSGNCTPRTDWTVTYAVASGDTLFKIANLAGSSIPELATGNCLASPDSIFAGQVLRLPHSISQPLPTGQTPVGSINISSYIAADAGNFTLLRGDTITLRWDGAPAGLSQASFYAGSISSVIGIDTNPSDGFSMVWIVPAGVSGALGAIGTVPNVGAVVLSNVQGVYSAPAPGQGCEIAASSAGVTAYVQPDVSSGVFSTLTQGQYMEVLGRSLNGWYGFDPGAAVGGSIGPARLRWVSPDSALTTRGPTCGGDVSSPVTQTYSNSTLGIAFDYPGSWHIVESAYLVDVYLPDGQVALEVHYGPDGQAATPINQAVSDFKSAGAGIDNRPLLSERPLSISGGFGGTRLDMGPDPVDNQPSANSVIVFSIVKNRNITFTGFIVSSFDLIMNTVRAI